LARAALAPARRPVVFLSGGASVREFTAGLELMAEAGVRFAGALCGRAIWQDGIAPFAAGGREALDRWLEAEGRGHLATVAACLARCAAPVA
ncbi:MAG: tagatose 1,6-diphosphate aldolase, partial [Terriglobales bacterium]